MTNSPLAWIGLAGIEPGDNARAFLWEKRLHGVMVGVALLAVPAYFLASAQVSPALHRLVYVIDFIIFAAFLGETVWMTHVSSHPSRYLIDNWLNLVILVGALASVLGASTEWVAVVRVMRVTVAGLVLVRTVTGFGMLFTRRGAPILVGVSFVILLSAGGLLYWIEPTVESYWDGLWLAFVTGMTIGYGDVVPTTGASRAVAAGVGLIGVALVTLFTASIVSFFVGGEEAARRRELLHDITQLHEELRRLFSAGEIRSREELNRDVKELRQQLAQLSADLALLRAELAQRGKPTAEAPPPANER